jgi:NADP-dependent 3-hydroxy acid dehydrogenase YdfG
VALRRVKAGARVVIGGRDEATLKQAASEIDPSGDSVRICAGDIAQQKAHVACQRMMSGQARYRMVLTMGQVVESTNEPKPT